MIAQFIIYGLKDNRTTNDSTLALSIIVVILFGFKIVVFFLDFLSPIVCPDVKSMTIVSTGTLALTVG